jgi:uncharacterized protein YecE (DUF72 family)
VNTFSESFSAFVGVGGWAYFPTKLPNKLAICAKIFDFVELNSSFYKLPQESLALKWRMSVPDGFQFSVRANRKLTHENHLEPLEQTFKEYERNLTICKALRAFVLHFQFPPSFEVTNIVLQNWRGFFGSLKKEKGLNFAIEVRNPHGDRKGLRALMDDFDIIPTSDPSRGDIELSKSSKIAYSRVFGRGEHTKWTFSTRELEELKQKVLKAPAARRYLTFHNLTMYEDGVRMKQVLQPNGRDPEATAIGIDSLKDSIIAERIQFPIVGRELSSRLGWRTVTMPDGQRVHVDEIMKDLEGTHFGSLGEVLDKCEPRFMSNGTGQGS